MTQESKIIPISDLLDPQWMPSVGRLLTPFVDEVIKKSHSLGRRDPLVFPEITLARLREGLLLDVGCGINFGFNNTLVDLLSNAYGIDPALINPEESYIMGSTPPKDRVIGGFVEDMPFRDKLFRWTLSSHCVGWYPNVAVNPYWAIYEMVRVTEDEGLITIFIGQRIENGQIILDAAQKVREGQLGERIAAIKDFTDTEVPQVGIRLA